MFYYWLLSSCHPMSSHPLGMLLVQNPKWLFTNGICMYKMSVIIILIFFCCYCVCWWKWLVNCFILLILTERKVKSDEKCSLLRVMTKLNSLAEGSTQYQGSWQWLFSFSRQVSILISLCTKLTFLYFSGSKH